MVNDQLPVISTNEGTKMSEVKLVEPEDLPAEKVA